MSVDESFRRGDRKPACTVADLISELEELPPNLELAENVIVTVTTVSGDYLAVEFERA